MLSVFLLDPCPLCYLLSKLFCVSLLIKDKIKRLILCAILFCKIHCTLYSICLRVDERQISNNKGEFHRLKNKNKNNEKSTQTSETLIAVVAVDPLVVFEHRSQHVSQVFCACATLQSPHNQILEYCILKYICPFWLCNVR